MVRRDLLRGNVRLIGEQGRVLGEVADPDCHVCIVTNPVNTIARVLLDASNGKLKPKNVSSLTRTDHNRATALVAERAHALNEDVKNCIIWGNHSSTQVPDINSATVKGVPVREIIKDDAFLDGEFMEIVRDRGYKVLRLRGRSSGLGVASATVDHVHDWILGTPEGTHVSMVVHSDGNPYGVPPGLFFSSPVKCSRGEWQFADNVKVTPKVAELLAVTAKELEEECAEAESMRSGAA
ncbi:cytosolic malate dehydrogenase [Trypanosoma rangeli SC58]|uniref:Cytosolic malate dehydrogenase n=1 Tax=Trypanosoma rangeli SC58 TaxID=429131 RepID=A0A061IS20_TRYRA|nr:cytosolic malate dehydrogenase [Trypanosoma rangeli SC58]